MSYGLDCPMADDPVGRPLCRSRGGMQDNGGRDAHLPIRPKVCARLTLSNAKAPPLTRQAPVRNSHCSSASAATEATPPAQRRHCGVTVTLEHAPGPWFKAKYRHIVATGGSGEPLHSRKTIRTTPVCASGLFSTNLLPSLLSVWRGKLGAIMASVHSSLTGTEKYAIRARLMKEGRWVEAEREKDAMLALLKKHGVPDAVDASWLAIDKRYPPLPPGVVVRPATGGGVLSSSASSSDVAPVLDKVPEAWVDAGVSASADLVDDILWVYHNLSKPLNPDDFPNGGCWGLYQWARQNRNYFYQTLLPKAVAARKAEGEEDWLSDERMEIEEIERRLKEV